jgi:TonB-linked SusC/RagA family outer membrane protein
MNYYEEKGDFLKYLRQTMRIMRLSLFLIVISTAMAFSASSYSQNTKLTLGLDNARVKEVIQAIEDQSEFLFFYQEKHVDLNRQVTLHVTEQDVETILNQLFEGTDNIYVINDRQIVIGIAPRRELEKQMLSLKGNVKTVIEQPQQKEITGKVTDTEGLPLPGVSVVIKGTTIGTITNADGEFSLKIPFDTEILQFSFVGMKTQEIPIEGKTAFAVTMEEESIGVDEVVVTALGIERETKALGFSAQKIGEDDLSASRELSVAGYLAGKVAGVQISKTGTGAGGSTNVVIRGNSSIAGSNQPLYVVDGVPIINYSNDNSASGVASADIDYGDGIGDLNPQDVESMNVLKGPAATALYGSRGANGVILITTKSGKKGGQGLGIEVNSGVTFEELYLIPNFQNEFGSGYDDEGYANYSWGGFTFDGIYYNWPENGQLDSWGGPLDGSIKIPNWWTLPEDGSIPSSVWDNPITEAIPYVAQPRDNVRNFFNTGVTFSNNVALTSSNEKSSMRLSLGDVTTSGIVPNHEIKKKSVSFNGTTKVNKFLSFTAKINYIRTEGDQRPRTGYSASNPMYNLISMARNTPLDFVKYQYETTKVNIRYPGINYNPYYMLNEVKNNDFKDRVVGLTSTTLQFTDWLSLMGRVGVDFYSQAKETRWPQDPNSRNAASRQGQMTQTLDRTRDINADVILTANKNVSENFSLNGVLGASIRSYRSDWMYWDAREFKAKDVYDISNFNDIRPSSRLYEKEMQSVFFTGQIGYKNYLFVDITGRNDWSSALGVNNQSFFYPSVSSSFIFTEAFNIDNSILSFGKVRASWAQVGNDSDPYMTRSGYNLYTTGFNGLPYATMSGTIPLLDLKNELTESVEFGVDMRFFKNRLSMDLTYYDGKTSNQILSLPVSSASGYSSAVINAGEIKNSGIEATLGITPVTGDFRWDINFNYAANRSEVVVLDGKIQTYRIIGNAGEPALSDIHAQVGAAYGNIIGYAYKRAPDGQKIVNAAGRYVRESETSVLGNITPDWIGGLNNTFSYKGFALNVLLDFVQGGDVVSATKYEMTRKGTGAWTVEGRRPKARYDEGDDIPAGSAVGDPMPYTGVLDGVVEIEDESGNVVGYEKNTKAVPGQSYWANRAWDGIGEEFVEDGSYISLREVMLSYRFKPSLLNKTPLAGVTLTAVGRNLAYLQNKMDYLGLSPESDPNTAGGASGIEALAVPSTRTYGFNIKLTF